MFGALDDLSESGLVMQQLGKACSTLHTNVTHHHHQQQQQETEQEQKQEETNNNNKTNYNNNNNDNNNNNNSNNNKTSKTKQLQKTCLFSQNCTYPAAYPEA